MKHKNRVDRIERNMTQGDGEIVIIRLGRNDTRLPTLPTVLRRGQGGHLIRKIGVDTIPAHLRGADIPIID